MEDNYPKAYKEVIEILNYVPKESVEKILQTMIDTFKAKMDTNYNFKVDINKSFEEQELLKETKAILPNIFRDYWASPEQKEKIKTKQQHDMQIIEEEKRKKYNPDSIFKDKQSIVIENIAPENNEQHTEMIEYKEQKWYQKIFNLIKNLFHRN